jgi:hypothetical protein
VRLLLAFGRVTIWGGGLLNLINLRDYRIQKVGGIGTSDRTAHQVHVAGTDGGPTVTGKQAGLLANALIAAVGFACAGVAVGAPRGAERYMRRSPTW